jgi:hypothetical protein
MQNKSGFLLFLKENIPSTVLAIGLSSLLANIATSVIFSGTALYMKVVLGTAVLLLDFLKLLLRLYHMESVYFQELSAIFCVKENL